MPVLETASAALSLAAAALAIADVCARADDFYHRFHSFPADHANFKNAMEYCSSGDTPLSRAERILRPPESSGALTYLQQDILRLVCDINSTLSTIQNDLKTVGDPGSPLDASRAQSKSEFYG